MIQHLDNGKPRQMRGFPLLLLLASLATSCGEKSDMVILKGEAQGSTFTIKYRDAALRDLSVAIDSTLKAFDQSLSLWVPGSTVNKFNEADSTFTSDDIHFRIMVARSASLWYDTQGAFDPTVLPLVKAWGLGSAGRKDLDTAAVEGLRRLIGMDRIEMDDLWRERGDMPPVVTYSKAAPEVMFDPNAIAQGYSVDVIAQLLEAAGIENYMVEVGGELRARGLNDRGAAWTIQIDEPVEGQEHQRHTVVPLTDRSLATSGNYRKFIEIDGQRYGHAIDPRTGRSAMNSMLSATILADDCATADALATAMLVFGPEAAKEWLSVHPEVDAYFILDDGQAGLTIWKTGNWPAEIP